MCMQLSVTKINTFIINEWITFWIHVLTMARMVDRGWWWRRQADRARIGHEKEEEQEAEPPDDETRHGKGKSPVCCDKGPGY